VSQKKEFDYVTKGGEVKSFTINVKINTYLKLYFATSELPEELVRTSTESLKQGNNTFDKPDDLFNFVNRIIEDHESSFTEETRSKVILYELNSKSKDDSAEIDFRFKVLTKVVTKKGGEETAKYYEERLLVGGSLKFHNSTHQDIMLDLFDHNHFFTYDQYLEMAWTAERQLWFENSLDLMRELALKIRSGFGTKPQVLAKRIDDSGLKHQLVEFKEKDVSSQSSKKNSTVAR
jgi:hypothetical protein